MEICGTGSCELDVLLATQPSVLKH